jgi:arsenite methyltransferase
MSDEKKIRATVSEAYARAVTAPAACGCGTSPVLKGVAAKLAGYNAEQLAALPVEAVENAFGCGDPVAFTEIRPGQTVLDLGSGAGIDLLLAARRVGPNGKVIGVDMTDEMIAKARTNIAAAAAGNVEVRKGIIEELPVETGTVDWVISNCVINLSPEKHRVFAEIARVLKPGGRMLVSDLVAEDLPDFIRQDPALYCSCISGAISEAAYLQGLRDAGLTDVTVRARLDYDREQLESLVGSETNSGCCGTATPPLPLDKLRQMAGKVASIKVYARKGN